MLRCEGSTALPESAATAGPPGLALMVRLAILSPALVGLKRTCTLQVPWGASAAPQASAPPATISNSVGFWPSRVGVIMPVMAPPVLVTVKVVGSLMDMLTVCGKAKGLGETVS